MLKDTLNPVTAYANLLIVQPIPKRIYVFDAYQDSLPHVQLDQYRRKPRLGD